MNILQIVTLAYPCGTGRHVLLLTEELQKRGHQVTVVCSTEGWLRTQLQAKGVSTVGLAVRPWERERQFLGLARAVRCQPIDLVHTHTTRAAYYGALLSQVTSVPVIATLHNLTHDLVFRRLLPRKANRLLVVSNALRQTLLEQKVPRQYMRTVYNGTDFAERTTGIDGREAAQALRRELALPPNAQLVGLVGDVSEEKGHPLLLEAIPAIVAQCPLAHFVFAGYVHPATYARLLETAVRYRVEDRLHFLGVRQDMPTLLAALDVLTVASQWETFGMAVIEAMAVGTPVVAVRVGGIPEIVEDGRSGLVVERTPAALAQAIFVLLRDPCERVRLQQNGRRQVQERFSVSTMVDQVEETYCEALQQKRTLSGTALCRESR